MELTKPALQRCVRIPFNLNTIQTDLKMQASCQSCLQQCGKFNALRILESLNCAHHRLHTANNSHCYTPLAMGSRTLKNHGGVRCKELIIQGTVHMGLAY